jgi:glycosyltransferase involved in cell wall biosynthesis
MKIIQVTQRFFPAIGGVETHVYNITKNLVARGHEVTVYTSDLLKDNPPIRLLCNENDKIDEIRIRRFKAFRLLPEIEASTVMPSMMKSLLKERADILHAHGYYYFPAYLAAIARHITGIPLVLTTHSGPESRMPTLTKLYNPIVGKFCLKKTDQIISLTRRGAEYLTSIGARSEKITVIPNGIDTNFFSRRTDGHSFREKYGILGKVILYVGRISKVKGLNYLVDAMPAILNEVPDAILVIIGPDFGLKTELRRRAKQLCIEKKVLFIGPLTGDELVDSYAVSDVFVLPSIHEAMAMVLLEAMAMGKPVIATDTGAARDLIQNGVNGFVIKPRRPDQIAKAVISLIKNRTFATKMGDINRKIASKHSWDNITQLTSQVYRKLCRV